MSAVSELLAQSDRTCSSGATTKYSAPGPPGTACGLLLYPADSSTAGRIKNEPALMPSAS